MLSDERSHDLSRRKNAKRLQKQKNDYSGQFWVVEAPSSFRKRFRQNQNAALFGRTRRRRFPQKKK